MRKMLYSLVTLCLALSTACQKKTVNSSTATVQTIIDSLQIVYAPDKRVAIWEITLTEHPEKILLKGKTNLATAKNQLQVALASRNLEWTDSILVLPHPILEDKIYGIVNLSACNIRSRPSHSAELATQSTLGTLLKIWDKSGEWYRVQTPDGYLGWLDPGGLQPITVAQQRNYQQESRVVYLADMGFSYAEADDKSQRVSDLLAGNILIRTGSKGRFTKVAYPDGRSAYIPTQDLMDWKEWLASRKPTAENILAKAQAMLGRPYLWGGTSGKAFDCSGFTKTVFYLNGLLLPRDASQQIHVGLPLHTPVISDLQAGDLLFFGRAATSSQQEKITHVAIYMGNSKIIHASGSVKIESLDPDDPDFAAERLASFVRATRPLQMPGQHGIFTLENTYGY